MNQLNIYIRMKHHIDVDANQTISMNQLAEIIAEPSIRKKIDAISMHKVQKSDHNLIVIDVMTVIARVKSLFPEADVQTVGPAQTILRVNVPKRKYTLIAFLFVWLLLFFGSGLAIMNFHEDVSMQAVQQKIYFIITGTEKDYPLLFQIPYSFGLGLGMILFFNHLFKKKFNEEPGPLEVEMFNYQQDLDQYLILKEIEKGEKK